MSAVRGAFSKAGRAAAMVGTAGVVALWGFGDGGQARAAPLDTPGSSAAAIDSNVLRISSALDAGAINAGIGRLFGDAASTDRFGVWATGDYSHLDFDPAPLSYKGHFATGTGGVDYRVNRYLAVGLAGGYANSDLTTAFNDGTLKTDGFNLAPYVALRINRFLVASVTGGHAWLSTDMTRSGGAVTGSYDGHRWFGDAALTGRHVVNNWELGGQLGYLYARETDDGYTESTGAQVGTHRTSLAQGRAEVHVGYRLGLVTPYVLGRVEHEFSHPSNVAVGLQTVSASDTGYVLGGGLAFGSGPVTGGIEATSTQGRDDLSAYDVRGTVRLHF